VSRLPEQPAYPLELAAQFFHAGKAKGGDVYTPTAGAVEAHPHLYGATVEAWNAQLAVFGEAAQAAARELGEHGASLPFADGERILALGDSITDDAQSWAEILRHLLEGCDVEVVNAGVSGATSTDLLGSVRLLAAVEPTTVVVMIGTNDSVRMGDVAKTLVSDAEFDANLRALGEAIAARAGVRLVWMTPPPAHEGLLAQSGTFEGVRLVQGDVLRKAEVVRKLPGPVVDVMAAFGDPPDAALFLEDGIHPNLEGQKAILRALLRTLGV
jgi:lysophospholipase L1-like esterase